MNNQSRLAAALAVSLLAACSGGTSSVPQMQHVTPLVPVQPSPAASASRSTAQFAITVPHAASSTSSLRRPQYVSPNTGSVRISILSADGVTASVPDTVAHIAYGAPGCASDTSQPLTCAVSVSAPIGHSVAFTVSTYQSSDGSGAVLATATVSAPVVAAKLNTIPITLGGVAASIAMSPSNLSLVADGQVHAFHLTVNSLDASGATIVGAAPLANPVTLAVAGDTNSALQLSTNNVTTPGQLVQLTYRGSVALNSATITASSGTFATSLAIAPLQVSPLSLKMISNGHTAQVTVRESGFTKPFSITLGDTSLATMAISPTTNGASDITLTSAAAVQGKTALTIGDGNVSVTVPLLVAPVIFNYFNSGLNKFSLLPWMTNGPNGKFWFTDQGTNKVGVFDPVIGGSTEYSAGLGPNDTPDQIVTGPDGNVYFTDFNSAPTSFGRIDPGTGKISLFTVPTNGVTTAITVGPDNKIWFTNAYFGAFQFGVFDPATTAITLYPLPSTALVYSMTTGPDRRVWFTDFGFGNNAIGVMDPATHVVTEYRTGLQTGAAPWIITTGPDGNLWFTEHSFMHPAIGKIVPSTGAITEYPVSLAPGVLLDGIVSAHGKLWFTAPNLGGSVTGQGGSSIGSIDPATGQITQYSFGMSPYSSPYTPVLGPDNELWFSDSANIGQAIIP